MAKKRNRPQNGSWFDSYWESHAFKGELPFDLVYEFLGKRHAKVPSRRRRVRRWIERIATAAKELRPSISFPVTTWRVG